MSELKDEPRIKIDGVDGVFILMTNDKSDHNGPVTTQEDYDAFEPGYGHMYDGTIKRYGSIVCGREGWHFVTEVNGVEATKNLQANTTPVEN